MDDTGRPMGQAMVYMEEVRAGDTNLSHWHTGSNDNYGNEIAQ